MANDGTLDPRHSFYSTPPKIIAQVRQAAQTRQADLTDAEMASAVHLYLAESDETVDSAVARIISNRK